MSMDFSILIGIANLIVKLIELAYRIWHDKTRDAQDEQENSRPGLDNLDG